MDFIFKPVLLIMVLCSLQVSGQQFGGIPPSLKWKQINSDTARIIFPKGMEGAAQQVASIIEQLSRYTLPTVGTRQRKIDIVFQTRTTISNGYVQLAPFRSEFELTADQNSFELGSLPWQKQLAIHEYRHVQQYNNFRVGLSRAFYYLFGEGGQELANNLSVPNWFWEGDAVYQETLVSEQGRGRLPFFFNSYRALWAGKKDYSWMKLRNGSLRDYVPDHYPLGYMEIAYGREKFGDDFWRKVGRDAAAFKGVFYPLQKAIARYSGLSFGQYRQQALDFFKNQLNTVDAEDSLGKYAAANRHFVADEEFPQFLDDNHIIYVRTTYKRPHSFVIRNLLTQRDSLLRFVSVSLDNYFSYANGKVVYSAFEPDMRWGWEDYGVIRLLDLATGKDRRVTSHSKYFSPDISQDGRHIAAVHQGVDGKTTVHILNTESGKTEKIIPNHQALYYSYPKFLNSRQIVSAIRNQKGEMALALVNIEDGTPVYLTPFSMNPIGFPSVVHDTIYFTATYQGHEHLFAASEGHFFKLVLPVVNRSTGDYSVQAAGSHVAWTSFTAVGYKISTALSDQVSLEAVSADQLSHPLQIQGIRSLDTGPADLLDSLHAGRRPVSDYPSTHKLLNFHSWRPYVNDPVYNFSLVSENILSTLQSNIYVAYNRNEGYTELGVDAIYGGLFPWIDAGYNYTFNRNALFGNEKVYWNETQVRTGLSVPFNFSRGGSYTSLQGGSDIVYSKRYFTGSFKDSLNSQGFAYIDPAVNFTHQIQMAPQQIYPKWAQSVSLNYSQAVTSLRAFQFLASGYFYLPGIIPVHSLVLGAAFQQRDSLNNARFSNNFPFSRGYSSEDFYRMYRLSANYHFPIVYPDWGFWNMVYFLRIRANIYYDYTQALDFYSAGTKFQQAYRSYGAEIYFDTKWWNQLPISFGIRYSRLIDPDFEGRGPNQWEFILPLTILSY